MGYAISTTLSAEELFIDTPLLLHVTSVLGSAPALESIASRVAQRFGKQVWLHSGLPPSDTDALRFAERQLFALLRENVDKLENIVDNQALFEEEEEEEKEKEVEKEKLEETTSTSKSI